MNNNELTIMGIVNEVLVKKRGYCKFIVKSTEADYQILCSAKASDTIQPNDIVIGKKIYVQGLYGLHIRTNRAGQKVYENDFRITNLY